MASLDAAFTNRTGVVASFDDHVGAGTVRDAVTDEVWPFHCTRIADGSRTIPAGVEVGYRVEPGPTGFEAVAISRTRPDPG